IEVVLLLLVTFALFRPDWFMNHVAPKYEARPVSQLFSIAAEMPESGRFVAVLSGMNLEGDELRKTVAVALPPLPEDSEATGDNSGRYDRDRRSAFRERRAQSGLGTRLGHRRSVGAQPQPSVGVLGIRTGLRHPGSDLGNAGPASAPQRRRCRTRGGLGWRGTA